MKSGSGVGADPPMLDLGAGPLAEAAAARPGQFMAVLAMGGGVKGKLGRPIERELSDTEEGPDTYDATDEEDRRVDLREVGMRFEQ